MNLNSSTYEVPVTELLNLGLRLKEIINGLIVGGLTYVIAEIPNHDNTCEIWRISLLDLIDLGLLLNLTLDKLNKNMHMGCKPEQILTIKVTIIDELMSKIDLKEIPKIKKL